MIVTQGGRFAGWGLVVRDGKPVWAYKRSRTEGRTWRAPRKRRRAPGSRPPDPGAVPPAPKPPLRRRLQRLIDVGEDVVDVLDADRQAYVTL